MRVEVFASFRNIILARLNPLDPVTPLEARRHLVDTLVFDVLLQRSHALSLKLRQIIPSEENSPIAFRSFILSHLVALFGDEIKCLRRWDVSGVLSVVTRVLWVVRICVVDRLFQLFEILFVGPFLVKVTIDRL